MSADPNIEKRALELWRQRELTFEPRVRRMNPDDLDRATGAWASCVFKAVMERDVPIHPHDT